MKDLELEPIDDSVNPTQVPAAELFGVFKTCATLPTSTVTPRNFVDQIKIKSDGTAGYIYIQNIGWKTFTLT
jgi:hypothetical protein